MTSQPQPSVEICMSSNLVSEPDDGLAVSEQTPRLQPGSPKLNDVLRKDHELVPKDTRCQCFAVVMTGAGRQKRTSYHHTLPKAEKAGQEALWRGRSVVILEHGHHLRGPLEVIDRGREAS